MKALGKVVIRILILASAIAIAAGIGNYLSSVTGPISPARTDPLSLLAPTARTFAQPDSGSLTFPEDHGIHRGSGIEIWQLIGFLESTEARRFGFDAMFSRLDLGGDLRRRKSAWASDQIYRSDLAVTPFVAPEPYRDRETARMALGLAGYDPKSRTIRVYRRTLRFEKTTPTRPKLKLTIPDGRYPADLELTAAKAPVIPSDSAPFRYYSISRMRVEGRLRISNQEHSVHGQAFFEHLWGNLPLATGQLVRNRFILHLSNNSELSLLQSRRRDGSGRSIETGFVVFADSESKMLESGDLEIEATAHWKSLATGIHYPTAWRIRIPESAAILDLRPWKNDQETGSVPTDWSGMVSVSGHFDSEPVTGSGYVQLSGYRRPARR